MVVQEKHLRKEMSPYMMSTQVMKFIQIISFLHPETSTYVDYKP